MDIERVYVKANMSNGLCGCDEEYVMAIDIPFTRSRYDRSLYIWDIILEKYSYANDFCAIETYEEDAEEMGYDPEEWYDERVNESSGWTEITKEEYFEYVDEGEIEVR